MIWPTTAAAARIEQDRLRGAVRLEDDFAAPALTIAGVDAGFSLAADGSTLANAAVVVLRLADLQPIAWATASVPAPLPYIPGLLSFREDFPAILAALAKLPSPPDLIMCDGQGCAHPRRFGIACHLGVLLDRPTLGCAKSRLIGSHPLLADSAGSAVPLSDGDEQIGWVLRSRTATRPLYLSPGHRVSMATTLTLVQGCLTRYRLPEPIRAAHRLASHGLPPAV